MTCCGQRNIFRLVLVFILSGAATGVGAVDSLQTEVVWFDNDRLYFNRGAAEGVTPGWLFRSLPGDTAFEVIIGGIDQVYPDLCSAPWIKQAGEEAIIPADWPVFFLYPPSANQIKLPHLRVGLVNHGAPFSFPEDIIDNPLLSSLFLPWTREGELGGGGLVIDSAKAAVSDGTTWAIIVDSLVWSGGEGGGEFPSTRGALADRLQGIIYRQHNSGGLTPWALRPPQGSLWQEMGVFFSGFSQIGDSALGVEFATPFYTFPEYLTNGRWRRQVAAAWQADAELVRRPAGWEKINSQTWVQTIQPSPFSFVPSFIDTITVRPFADYANQWLAFEMGQLDLCQVSINDYLRLQTGGAGHRFISQVSDGLVFFGVNQQRTDLADNRLTTAVCYLVDKPALVRALLAERGEVAQTIFPTGKQPPQDEPYYAYDPAKGRQILADLQLGRTLNFYIDPRIDRGKTIARYIAGKLSASGIKTRLMETRADQLLDSGLVESADMILSLWTFNPEKPDPDFYYLLVPPSLHGGENPLTLADRELWRLLEESRREKNRVKREQIYRQIEYRLLAEPYICPLYRPINTIAAGDGLPELLLTPAGEINILPAVESATREKVAR